MERHLMKSMETEDVKFQSKKRKNDEKSMERTRVRPSVLCKRNDPSQRKAVVIFLFVFFCFVFFCLTDFPKDVGDVAKRSPLPCIKLAFDAIKNGLLDDKEARHVNLWLHLGCVYIYIFFFNKFWLPKRSRPRSRPKQRPTKKMK